MATELVLNIEDTELVLNTLNTPLQIAPQETQLTTGAADTTLSLSETTTELKLEGVITKLTVHTGAPGTTDHLLLTNIGVNTHLQLDSHLADLGIHFSDAPSDSQDYVRNNLGWVVASAGVTDHLLLTNIGVNTHSQIDTHLSDTGIHFSDAPADSQDYVRNNNTWIVASAGVTDHGLLTGLGDDDHSQYALLIGRSGGQTLIGSPTSAQTLTIQGSSGANPGFINANSPIIFGSYSLNPSAAYGFSYTATETFNAGFVGGGLNFSGNITFNNGVFIYESFRGAPVINTSAAPGFAAYTVLQALPLLNAGAVSTENPLNALIINAGATMQNTFVGTRTVATSFGLSFSPQTRASGGSGRVMTITNQTAVSLRPTFSTVSGSTANLGNVRGLHCQNPAVALFQPQTGVETMTAYIGIDFDNISFGGNIVKAAVRSAKTAATNSYFLLNNSTARSSFGSSDIEFNDLNGVVYGTSQDFRTAWSSLNFYLWQFNGSSDQLRFSNPSANRFLFNDDSGSAEFNFNCDKFSIGGQTGSVGNQVGVFVAPTRSTSINGGWADFLLTQAGNLTINNTMSDVSAWVINPISLTNGTGSITGFVAGLQCGMTTSNLGGADTMALRNNGRLQLRGVLELPPLEPANLTADVNDYQPATFNAMRQVIAISTDDLGVRTITGLALQQTNDTQTIVNIGTVDNILLTNQDVLSTASNRFITHTGATLTLAPSQSVTLWHDTSVDRWFVLSTTGT